MIAHLAQRRFVELSAFALFICLILSRGLTPTQSSPAPQLENNASSSSLYLYNTIDSSPILDHGLKGADYTSSNAPKVVEFYDPKCGACQAFKYNYIEVAKKVRETRPDVQFYGVSCALHSCDGVRVPKIVVFSSADAEGVEVQKGSGAIYFLSQRLLKALRSPDEIAAASAKLESFSRRRLRAGEDDDEHAYGSEDVNLDEDADHETREEDIPQVTVTESKKKTKALPVNDNKPNKQDSAVDAKWDLDKLVEIKGVPRDQWKPIHETDAWKNTMNELQNSDSKLGAQFLKWKQEHDAKLSAQSENNDKEKNRPNVPDQDKSNRVNKVTETRQPPRAETAKNAEEKKRLDYKIDGDVKKASNVPKQNRSNGVDKAAEAKSTPQLKQIEINQNDVPPPQVFPPNLPPEQEKKFKEFIEKKRQAAIRHEQLKHPVNALIGGNDAKTVEQKKKNQSPMNNYKSQYKPIPQSTKKNQQPKADLRLEAQQKSTRQKILSKVPIVKRAFNKHSHAHDTLNDAALSFTRGLSMGVFKGNTKGPLDYKRKKALKDWFDLLSVSLPPEMGLHELIDTLNANIDGITASEVNLKTILEKHYIPDSNWSKSCTAEAASLGFFCGFWKLLHIMSLGVAEQAGGLVLQESNPSTRVFSTQEAASVLREYMVYFFNCEKCVQKFVGQYDNCSFQRCNRLSKETEYASVDSWRQFPLWLWEIHNDVSRSKANRAVDIFETRGRKAEARKFERDMRAVYPHIDQCVACYDNEGKWNVDVVYKHLEQEYWDFGHDVSATVDKMLDYSRSSNTNASSGLRMSFFVSIAIAAITWVIKKRKMKMTGRHKKHEFECRSFPSRNGNTKYRDS